MCEANHSVRSCRQAPAFAGSLAAYQEGKPVEEAMCESEELWRTVFEHLPTMCFMVDAASTIVSVNSFGAEQLGYTFDELVGHSVLNFFHEADRDAVQR